MQTKREFREVLLPPPTSLCHRLQRIAETQKQEVLMVSGLQSFQRNQTASVVGQATSRNSKL